MKSRLTYLNKKVGRALILVLLLVLPNQGHSHKSIVKSDQPKNRVFISLSYVPAYGGVFDFDVGDANDGTSAVLPYIRSRSGEVLKAANFDWALKRRF